ncbi:sensor histidine kinase [Cohnella nanjingensis]|uniref:histidine kinase n=1 Tax=Cohnella nanjingensis TaxID=1387779 RepID=A0A7X0RQW3_9BACL|nr:HAMP domain-containing sensor histidine kinase [Cohnella nanjingensis]MBB6671886.1 HAMP domain-containing histidine kinase [Cohnella nanjingensis]
MRYVLLLSALCVVLLLILIYALIQLRIKNKHICEIAISLENYSQDAVNSRVRLLTADPSSRRLIENMNQLLKEHENYRIRDAQTRDEMGKMLSNVSHDLRTPMTIILGYVHALNANPDMNSDQAKAYLYKVENKTKEIIDMMNDFFSLSKLESGDVQIQLSRHNVSEILRENILAYHDIITGMKRNVDISLPEEDCYALTNREALNRILGNLINNAIKYGADGDTIGFNVNDQNDKVYIEIWDNGKGIPHSQIQRIFERLYTLEESRSKDLGGSGLGLAIVKVLVEKMGGEIEACSLPYEKTSFRFYLRM